jgi:arginase family enzyme
MKAPYCEDIRKVGTYEAAFVGIPYDTGTTYRPGTRFGPQAVRRVSAVYDGYSVDTGVDLMEELDLCDAGDVFVIPGNLRRETRPSSCRFRLPRNAPVLSSAIHHLRDLRRPRT